MRKGWEVGGGEEYKEVGGGNRGCTSLTQVVVVVGRGGVIRFLRNPLGSGSKDSIVFLGGNGGAKL